MFYPNFKYNTFLVSQFQICIRQFEKLQEIYFENNDFSSRNDSVIVQNVLSILFSNSLDVQRRNA